MKNQRIPLDFYETPPWQSVALVRRVAISGTVFECCCGDNSLTKALPPCDATTNDINPIRKADFHLDAALPSSWEAFGRFDWVVTNPPFNRAFEILPLAVAAANVGVIFLGRLSFLEPTRDRGEWLSSNPPSKQIVLPRWSYKQNGKSDCMTTAWFVWLKTHIYPKDISIVGLEEKP